MNDHKRHTSIPIVRDARPAVVISKQRQAIAVMREPAFDVGHLDGFADASSGAPRDAGACFARRHAARPVSDFADYERGYVASYEQVKAMAAACEVR